jgi:hypothetical protein
MPTTPPEDELLSIEQLADVLGKNYSAVKKSVQRGVFSTVIYRNAGSGGIGGSRPFISISDPALPEEIRTALGVPTEEEEPLVPPVDPSLTETETDITLYASLPAWAKRVVDKRLSLISATSGMKGIEMMAFVTLWSRENPDLAMSEKTLYHLRAEYREKGLSALIPKWGRFADRKNSPAILDSWFDFFKGAYLVEGGPSARICWTMTFGKARRFDPSLAVESFPSTVTFTRHIEKKLGKEIIYLARRGRAAWNRKYAPYIDRNYDSIAAGEVWVSDHHQLDRAVRLPDGKYCFPWITVFRDMKTGKWLGWFLHAEAPNSDHIFAAFYRSARKYGIPKDIIIDNGKDYRCRDFAGGRVTKHRLQIDEQKTTAMVALLGIIPHFTNPYRAQSKPIERDFLIHKEWFCKPFTGYRGGNPTEKPEKLAGEIKRDEILAFDALDREFDLFVKEIFNRMESAGKVLAGMCRDEAWEKEAPVLRMVRPEALLLFCMRTSRPVAIGRNGIFDSEIGRTYWGEFMFGFKGTQVYLRRDPREYQEAWVFSAKTDELLGTAVLAEQVDALARTPESKAHLKAALSDHRRQKKMLESLLPDPSQAPSSSEALSHMAAGVAELNRARGYEPAGDAPAVVEPARTAMDDVVAKRREMERVGTRDLSAIVPMRPQKPPIFLWESDRDRYLAEHKG